MQQTKVNLSDIQIGKCREAIHAFIAAATAKYGRGSVILLPAFEEQGDGSWAPVMESNGVRFGQVRSDGKQAAFLRFGKMTINPVTGKPQYLYTNHFGDDEGELMNMLSFIDPNAIVGSAVRGIRMVVHESLKPFSRTNPERDIKWADQKAGLKCVKYVSDAATGEVKEHPIYRRTKVFFADDEGNYVDEAVNQLIKHDNTDQLSTAAFEKFAQASKANAGMGQANAKATRIAQLQAIPKAERTPEEKAELADLLEP